MLHNKTFAPEFCSLISNWFDMREQGSKLRGQNCCTILFQEQAPSCVLKFALWERISGASSLVCTEICFAGACFRSKLPCVYWLGYLPGSMFRERVSGASFFMCTGWSTYLGACFGSVFQEQAPSCVLALRLVATALGGLPICSCCLASGIGKLIAGSDGMICSPEDLTPFSALLLLSLDALPALSGVFLRIKMTSGSAVSTSVWHPYIV